MIGIVYELCMLPGNHGNCSHGSRSSWIRVPSGEPTTPSPKTRLIFLAFRKGQTLPFGLMQRSYVTSWEVQRPSFWGTY